MFGLAPEDTAPDVEHRTCDPLSEGAVWPDSVVVVTPLAKPRPMSLPWDQNNTTGARRRRRRAANSWIELTRRENSQITGIADIRA